MVYGGVKGMITVLVGLAGLLVGTMVGVVIMCLLAVGGYDDECRRDCNNEDRQDKEG